jgi:hypothetical protein
MRTRRPTIASSGAPYDASQQRDLDALQSFIQEIAAASPKTKVIVPKYFEAIPVIPPKTDYLTRFALQASE